VRRDVIHVDFLRVDPKVTLDVEVAIELTGEAEGVTRAGGIVQQLLHSLVVSTRPDNIPNSLELDVSELTLDGDLRVRDLVLPAGVTTDADPDDVVARALSRAPAPPPTSTCQRAAAEPTESAES
jgi:large subunit ribosomal protein L25